MLSLNLPFGFTYILGSGIGVFFIAFPLLRILYNLYFHPLAHIPSPKLAANTHLYQTNYSLVGGSRYYLRIAKLHEKFGMEINLLFTKNHLTLPRPRCPNYTQ